MKTKEQKVEELVKRVRLTPQEITQVEKKCYDAFIKVMGGNYSDAYRTEFLMDRSRIVQEHIAQAATNKVLNDKDLALIDRENDCLSLHGFHAVIPLAEALKEE